MDRVAARFWMLSEPEDWVPGPGAAADPVRRRLRLEREAVIAPRAEDRAAAEAAFQRAVAGATWTTFDAAEQAQEIRLQPRRPGATPPRVLDAAVGARSVVLAAVEGAVLLRDLRGRLRDGELLWSDGSRRELHKDQPGAAVSGGWAHAELVAAGLAITRVAGALEAQGVGYALAPDQRRLLIIRGTPLRQRPFEAPTLERFRMADPDPDPLRLEELPARWPADEAPVDLSVGPDGRLAVLAWTAGEAVVRLLDEAGQLGPPTALGGVRWPYALCWVDPDHVAVRATGEPAGRVPAALTYALRPGGRASPGSDLFPMTGAAAGLRPDDHPGRRPIYATDQGWARLRRVGLGLWPRAAVVEASRPLDAGEHGIAWHRLLIEAKIPAGCGIRVSLCATDLRERPADGPWYSHDFGDYAGVTAVTPRGVWEPVPSEIPHHPGLLGGVEPGRAGLWSVLVQRAGRAVRALRGRYLWVRVTLQGDGRAGPELAALRVWGPRQSLIEGWLPEALQEQTFGADADALAERSTPADFLERLLANPEGVLQRQADRLLGAWVRTHPAACPPDMLPELGRWIGLDLPADVPEAVSRDLIAAWGELRRAHGTIGALERGLEIVTQGGVTRGDVLAIEDFRLRRTFVSLVGVDLSDEEDPLMPGMVTNTNAVVGDTLVLGHEWNRSLLALFQADQISAAQAEEARAFFAALAWRVSVLARQDLDPAALRLARWVAGLLLPAHVQWALRPVGEGFIVGLRSLVGVNTRVDPPRPREGARLDQTRVGAVALIRRAGETDEEDR